MALARLPLEIWLEIFSELDYFGLKKCMRVCKGFKRLVNHSCFDAELFRSSDELIPKDQAIDLEELRMHPVFHAISYECAGDLKDVCVNTSDDFCELTDTCAANEFATDPPVTFLRIRIVEWKPIQVTNKNGITVVQVMKAMCRFFTNKDHLDSRGDHTGWHAGWDEVKVDRKGQLLLCSDWFDF